MSEIKCVYVYRHTKISSELTLEGWLTTPRIAEYNVYETSKDAAASNH